MGLDINLQRTIKKINQATICGYTSTIIFKDELDNTSDAAINKLITYLNNHYVVKVIDIGNDNFYIFISTNKRFK